MSGSPTPGGTITITCNAGTWTDNEAISITVSGNTAVTQAAFRTAVTSGPFSTTAGADGSSSAALALPSNASGTYTVTSTGEVSGSVDTETFTVVAAAAAVSNGSSSSSEVAATGSTIPVLIIWVASGLVLLGVAIVVVRMVVRRQRLNS
ncbi:hypothetical protein ACX9R5_18280 [Rathayibacter sp. CAU 1779]